MSKKDTDLAYSYCAGVLDCKGNIRIGDPKPDTRRPLLVWVTSQDFKLAEKLQRLGAYVSQRTDGQYKAKWKDRAAFNLLKAVLPLLGTMKEEAEIAMEFFTDKEQNPKERKSDIIFIIRLRLANRSNGK